MLQQPSYSDIDPVLLCDAIYIVYYVYDTYYKFTCGTRTDRVLRMVPVEQYFSVLKKTLSFDSVLIKQVECCTRLIYEYSMKG